MQWEANQILFTGIVEETLEQETHKQQELIKQ